MRWRKYLASAVVSIFHRDPPVKSADGLDEVYRDAATLVVRLYHDRRISRAVMQKRGMSNGRWGKARGLLLKVRVITEQNVIRDDVAPDADTADELVSRWIDEQRRRKRAARTYVHPPLTREDGRE